MRRPLQNAIFILLVAALISIWLPFPSVVTGQGTSYTTNFPLTEDPISEGGRWINGQVAGLDWKNVRTTPGLAFGADSSGTPNYNDPTALLSGTWGPNQTAQATVYSMNQKTGNVYEEVELRLRSTITAHSITGYEILFRCNHDGTWYTDIVRWNGPLGNFTSLRHVTSGPGIFNGDVVKATIVGNTITAYINGVQVNQVADSTFAGGSPGMGFYLSGAPGLNGEFGLTTFAATDATTALPTPPINLRIVR